MSRDTLLAFLKDERASATMEYLVLTGVLGLVGPQREPSTKSKWFASMSKSQHPFSG